MNKLRHKLERHWPNQLKQSTDGAAREKRDNATATSGRWGETTRQVQDDVSTQQQNKNQIQTKQQQQKKTTKKSLIERRSSRSSSSSFRWWCSVFFWFSYLVCLEGGRWKVGGGGERPSSGPPGGRLLIKLRVAAGWTRSLESSSASLRMLQRWQWRRGFLWDAYGMIVGCLWDDCGMIVGCLWDASEIFTSKYRMKQTGCYLFVALGTGHRLGHSAWSCGGFPQLSAGFPPVFHGLPPVPASSRSFPPPAASTSPSHSLL